VRAVESADWARLVRLRAGEKRHRGERGGETQPGFRSVIMYSLSLMDCRWQPNIGTEPSEFPSGNQARHGVALKHSRGVL